MYTTYHIHYYPYLDPILRQQGVYHFPPAPATEINNQHSAFSIQHSYIIYHPSIAEASLF
ncbi:hypothetical protein K439DRAFT_1626611 [Ramaria rubella]|nr:hypothetical protein K439DRAFT_1626611 [Ramaria rubella]